MSGAALSRPPASHPVRAYVVGPPSASRRAIYEAILAMRGVAVVGIGTHFEDARRKALRGEIDVVVIESSVPNVLGVVRAIVNECPNVVVRVASTLARIKDADAVRAGASGVFELSNAMTRAEVLGVSLAAAAVACAPKRSTRPPSIPANDVPARRYMVAIGASAGGRAALTMVLTALEIPKHTIVLITQHVARTHAQSLVESLARTGKDVRVPRDGEYLQPGRVYLASDTRHLTVMKSHRGFQAKHDDGPIEHGCKPAVDPMFRSVAAACGSGCIGVVLTGMGSDGARGARALREAGAPVIVQDAASSQAWGMPSATLCMGAANAVVPLTNVASEIARWSLP
jgi:two-component system chemotaxis response regulator CheB